jgi:hypothetical protein
LHEKPGRSVTSSVSPCLLRTLLRTPRTAFEDPTALRCVRINPWTDSKQHPDPLTGPASKPAKPELARLSKPSIPDSPINSLEQIPPHDGSIKGRSTHSPRPEQIGMEKTGLHGQDRLTMENRSGRRAVPIRSHSKNFPTADESVTGQRGFILQRRVEAIA